MEKVSRYMVAEKIKKIRAFFLEKWDDVTTPVIFLLVALAAFGLGRVSVLYETPSGFDIMYPGNGEGAGEYGAGASVISATARLHEEKNYVASLTGTKYHLPSCPGAKQIKEENKIWFTTKEDAEIAGYQPAANCPEI
jgi:hypothetical protein